MTTGLPRLSALALVLALLPASPAAAFCGFYVSSAGAELHNHATLVVLMREGRHTVLSMQNDYQGPPEDFALVVPVPEVLGEEDVRTLERDVFDRVERVSAPRLVEYWEQDPCAPDPMLEGLGTFGTGRGGGGTGFGTIGLGSLVTVEAQFAVGEYDIVILGARDSSALETWLREHDYRIPAGAAELLRPYVEAGTKFFVARVDIERVRFENGRAVLSPLRVHYEADELSLPVRLGLLSSAGVQDLIVNVLARGQRFEVANRPNVTIPTNLDVAPEARDRFAELYAALFDRTAQRSPGAVITEYAWQASSCDPCPPDGALTASDVSTLGADVVFAEPQAPAPIPRIQVTQPEVRGGLAPEVVRRVVRMHMNELRFCYEQALIASPRLAGRVTMSFTVDSAGAVTTASVASGTLTAAAPFAQCLTASLRRWQFPPPTGGGSVQVTYPIDFTASPGNSSRVAAVARDLVLTRLHYRYGRDDLGEDLVFRTASAIEGGRENRTPTALQELEQGATESYQNNFQARYVIRHPWTGPIECESPERGRWGGPPGGEAGREAVPATSLAHAPRGGIDLSSLIRTAVPALDLTPAVATARAQSPQPEAAPSVEPAPADPPAARAPASTCGCRVGAGRGALPRLAVILLLAALLRVRRAGSVARR